MDPSNFIPGIVLEDGNGFWNAPFGIEGFDSCGVPTPHYPQSPSTTNQPIPQWTFCEGSPPPHINLVALPLTIADPYKVILQSFWSWLERLFPDLW